MSANENMDSEQNKNVVGMVGPFTESHYKLTLNDRIVPFIRARYKDGDTITLTLDGRFEYDLPSSIVKRPDFLDLLCNLAACAAGWSCFGPNAIERNRWLGPDATRLRSLGTDEIP